MDAVAAQMPAALRTVGEKYLERMQCACGEVRLVIKQGSPDSPTRYALLDEAGTPVAYVAHSNERYPTAVEEAGMKADRAADCVGPHLASRIVQADEIGWVEGRSYAIYPWHRSVNGVALTLARYSLLRVQLLTWLTEVTEVSVHQPDAGQVEALFDVPLTRAAQSTELPPQLCKQFAACRDALHRGDFSPRCVLMHGDLWLGNVLFSKERAFPLSAVIIDWAGSSLDGHPIFDLVRLAGDLSLGSGALRRQLRVHTKILGCELELAHCHLLASLAQLYANLGEFEVRRFVDSAARMLDRLVLAGAIVAQMPAQG